MKIARVVSVSGGKDSTALWLYMRDNYPHDELFPVFADTGNEHPLTMEYLDYLEKTISPIKRVYPDYNFIELAIRKGRFPSARARFCTEHLKLVPVREYMNQLSEQGHFVEKYLGIRADESKARAMMPEHDYSSFDKCEVYRPLIKWQLDDVWAIHSKHGIKANPLYALGSTRVGCMPCIHAKKSEIRMIADQFPEVIEKLRVWEKISGRTFFATQLKKRRYCYECHTFHDDLFETVCTDCGEKMGISRMGWPIEVIVEWSKTEYGGKQYGLEFDQLAKIPEVCSTWNLCE